MVSYYRSIVAEGIDIPFDSLSCVFGIGIPYENIGSLENQILDAYFAELMKSDPCYDELKDKFFSTDIPWKLNKSGAINALCQGIGRSVRGTRDRAVIILIDSRLTPLQGTRGQTSHWKDFLPPWISDNTVHIEPTPKTAQDSYRILLKIFRYGY
jgi:Rad3-related DNA helicase